jgi:DNA-binding transcriptional ArsR family regulator
VTKRIDADPPDGWFETATDLLKLLAVESRLRILWALLHGEHSVNELAAHVGANPSAVSQHLRQLRQLGLVTTRRQGNFIFYACDHPHVRALVGEALSHARHLAVDHGGDKGISRRRAASCTPTT